MDYWQLAFGLLLLLPALLGLWGVIFRPHVYGSSFMLGFAAFMVLLFGAFGALLVFTAL